MTLSWEQLLSFGGMVFILGLIPAMGVVNVINFTVSRGKKSGAVASAGTITADLVYILLVTVGSSLVLTFFSHYGTIIRGASALLLLGFALEKFLKSPQPLNLGSKSGIKVSGTNTKVFLFCLGISLSNPKVFLFYLAFLPGIFDLARTTPVDVALILVTTIIVLTLAFGIVVFSAGFLSCYLNSIPRMKVFNRVVGVIILLFIFEIVRSLF